MAAAYGDFLAKVDTPRAFLGQEGLVAERGSRGGDRVGHTTPCRGQEPAAPPGGVAPSCLLSGWSSWFLVPLGWKITSVWILGFFFEVDISTQK